MERTLPPWALKLLPRGSVQVTLIDVRRRPAFEADPRVIPGAVWRDPHAVDAWAVELPVGMPVVVYCVHGHEVSNGVVDHLRSRGVDATLVEGGVEGWKAAGGAVVGASMLAQGGVP